MKTTKKKQKILIMVFISQTEIKLKEDKDRVILRYIIMKMI